MSKIINARNIFYPFLAFLFGLIVAKKFFGGQVDIIVITLLAILSFSILLIINKRYKFVVALLALFLLGNGVYFASEKLWTPRAYSGKVSIVGRIEDGIIEGDYSNYTVILDNVIIDGNKGENIRLTINRCEGGEPKAGDIIEFVGEVYPTKLFELGKFDSSALRKNAKLSGEINWSDINTIISGRLKFDERVRLKVRDIIFANMSEKNAQITYAVLFGDRTGVDWQIRDAYSKAGIIHILSVSGLHIGFLIALLFWFFKITKVNKYVRFSIITIFIIFYAYLCGFSPAVLRAGIMAIILMVAELLGRRYDGLNSLGLAGFIICLTRPLMAHDVGFLMSFFAIMTIYMIAPLFRRFFIKFMPFNVASLLATVLSAQIGVFPFMASFGADMNLLSPVVNLLIIPIFSVLYPFLFFTMFLALMLSFLGKLLVIVDFLFTVLNSIVRYFAWASFSMPVSSAYFGLAVLMYMAIFGASRFFMIDGNKKIIMLSASTLAFVTVFGCYRLPQTNNPRIAFLNEGTQYSLVVTATDGANVVIGENDLLRTYQIKYRTGDLGTFISPKGIISSGLIDRMSAMGTSNFISFSTQVERDEVVKAKINTIIDISTKNDKLSFAYLEFAGQYLGMELIFYDKTIFLVNNNLFSYNLIRLLYFPEKEPDIIITDHLDDFTSSDALIISSSPDIRGDYNYQRDGNLMLTFKGNNIIVRGLD